MTGLERRGIALVPLGRGVRRGMAALRRAITTRLRTTVTTLATRGPLRLRLGLAGFTLLAAA